MKKALIILALVIAAGHYLHQRYHVHDALVYAQKHQDSGLSPAIDYYVGFAYYMHDDYPQARDAFQQLLKSYPTGHYTMTALVYLDDSAEELMDWDASRAALSKYVDEYPNGPDIEMMKQRLQYVNYKHPAASPFAP